MTPNPDPVPAVTCFRCGQPAELTAPRSDWIGSEPESQLPLCADCLDLLTSDPASFWQPLRLRED